jgi:hypothetical protein
MLLADFLAAFFLLEEGGKMFLPNDSFQRLNDVMSQKIELIITTSVRAWNPIHGALKQPR